MKLSELALKTVEHCRNLDPKVWAPHWNYFHFPQHHVGLPCLVCLAGGYIAGEYDVSPTIDLDKQDKLEAHHDRLRRRRPQAGGHPKPNMKTEAVR